MNNKIKIDLKTFQNLFQMLKASEEDRLIALENIKNININDTYHKLFIKCLSENLRIEYMLSQELNFNYNDLTLSSIKNDINQYIESDKKNILLEIFKYIQKFLNTKI